MIEIKITHKAKWRLKDKPHYAWTEDKRLFNLRSNREIKKTLRGLTPGYWISKKFIPLHKLKDFVELIPKEKTPF